MGPSRTKSPELKGLNRGLERGLWEKSSPVDEDSDDGNGSEGDESDTFQQLQQSLQTSTAKPDPQSLMCLLMMKELRRSKRKGHGSSGSESDPLESGKGLKGIQALRVQPRKNHKKLLKNYNSRVKERLGVTHASQAWLYRDYSLRLVKNFGKLRGLWRCHYALSDILQAAVSDDKAKYLGNTMQMLKCLHQVALDNGSWHQGQLLLPDPDPLAQDEFGGDPNELQVVHKYSQALKDLKSKKQHGTGDHEDDDGKEPKGGGKGK